MPDEIYEAVSGFTFGCETPEIFCGLRNFTDNDWIFIFHPWRHLFADTPLVFPSWHSCVICRTQNQKIKIPWLCLHTFITFIISFECLNKQFLFFFACLTVSPKKSCLYLYCNTVWITMASTDATANRALATWQCLYTNSSLELCTFLTQKQRHYKM